MYLPERDRVRHLLAGATFLPEACTSALWNEASTPLGRLEMRRLAMFFCISQLTSLNASDRYILQHRRPRDCPDTNSATSLKSLATHSFHRLRKQSCGIVDLSTVKQEDRNLEQDDWYLCSSGLWVQSAGCDRCATIYPNSIQHDNIRRIVWFCYRRSYAHLSVKPS